MAPKCGNRGRDPDPLGERERDARVLCPEGCEGQPDAGSAGAVEKPRKLNRGVEAPAEKVGDDCHLSLETVQRLFQSRPLVSEERRNHALEQAELLETTHLSVERATPGWLGTSVPDQDHRALRLGMGAQRTVANGR